MRTPPRRPTVLALLLAAAAGCASPSPAPPPSPPPAPAAVSSAADSIDAWIAATLAELDLVPGLAVAVVHDTQTLLLRGYGWADLEARRPVEPSTPFYIASSTKSFTALAAALLDHRGALELDAPLSRSIPGLDLGPSLDPGGITVRDLLTHTSGIDNDAVVMRTAFTGEHDPETLRRVLALSTAKEDRSFDYGNIGYVVASLAVERAAGEPWQDALDELVFTPLGMDRTTAYVSEAEGWGTEVAAPYGWEPEGHERIPFLKTDATMHAAGGLVTTAEDLARWLEAQVTHGLVDGRQVLPTEVVRETHRPQAEVSARFDRFHRRAYGLGWYVADYDGETLVHHFGSFPGYRAHVSFMPEHGIGVAVLANTTGLGFFVPDLVATYVYDRLTGRPGLDSIYAARVEEMRSRARDEDARLREHLAERRARTPMLSRPPESYAGVYVSEAIGTMTIRPAGDALEVSVGDLTAVTEAFTEPETARVELVPGQGQVIRFLGDDGARPDSLSFAGETWRRVEG